MKRPFSDVTRATEYGRRHAAMVTALMAYDRKEAARAAKARVPHNGYAIAHYLGGLQRVEEAVAAGCDIREALIERFCGRLLNHLLRAIHEPRLTPEEREAADGRYFRGVGL